jgi:hypothetical protein
MDRLNKTVRERGSTHPISTIVAAKSGTIGASLGGTTETLAQARTADPERSSLADAVNAEPSVKPTPIGRPRAGASAELCVQVTLCVVVALLLLAVIAVPRLGDAHTDGASTRTAYELFSNLQKLRTAMGEYRLDHGVWPGASSVGPSLDRSTAAARDLVRQLTACSDHAGATHAADAAPLPDAPDAPYDRSDRDHPFGPYLDGRLPANPIVGLASVRVLGDDEEWPEPDEATGWIYRPATGEVRANCRGAVPTSTLRFYDL